MTAIIKHEGQYLNHIRTNHSMTIEEAMELAGLDINEECAGDPVYNYDELELESVKVFDPMLHGSLDIFEMEAL